VPTDALIKAASTGVGLGASSLS